ncbi:MAG: c-type cytochrome [Pseudomonadota bacterium]
MSDAQQDSRPEMDKEQMKAGIFVTAIVAGLLGAAQSGAQDLAEGGELYKKMCRSCHGPKAQGMASFPKLAGSTLEHLTMRLEQYRAGEKIGPNTPLMAPRAANLSDDDIINIVGFIVTTFE